MCGILIHKKEFNPKFNINHRGTSSDSIELDDFLLSHSSLPLQSHGSGIIQPVDLGNIIVLFNGEIFNVSEISEYDNDLEYLTKLLVNGFTPEVLEQVQLWDGFWSIVLYDKVSGLFKMMTDPLGKKQLYYNANGICSEIKPLIDDASNLIEYDASSFGTSKTIYDNVHRVLPNYIYEFDLNENELLSLKDDYYKIVDDSDLNLYDRIDLAVKRRLLNRIDKVSLLISGGLDSSIILYHTLKHYPAEKLELITIDNAEEEYVKFICDHLGIDYKKINLVYDDNKVEDIVRTYEHGLDYGSLIPQYLLIGECSNRVVLTGDGADELFGGYNRAKESDTFEYDVYKELPFFHHLRLDRIGMGHTKEVRNPFLGREVISFAHSLERKDRVGKEIVKQTYRGILPDEILDRKKLPLRNKGDKEYNLDLVKKTFNRVFKNI